MQIVLCPFVHPLCFVFVLRVTNDVIRSRKPEDRKYNSQNKNDKGTHSDLQNTTLKTRDWDTCPLLITAGELRYSGRVSSSCSTSATRRVTLVTNPSISHEWGKDRIVIMTNGSNPWSFVCEICKWHIYSVKVNTIINKNIRVTFFKYFKETHNNFYFCNIIRNFNDILNPSTMKS